MHTLLCMTMKSALRIGIWALGSIAGLGVGVLFLMLVDDAWILAVIAVAPLIVIAISTAPFVRRESRAARIGWWLGVVGWFLAYGNLAVAGAEFELTHLIASAAAVVLLSVGGMLRERRPT